MSKFEHLTKKQLSDYSVGALDRISSEEAGRHLLNCQSCRSSLPAPTVSQFRTALMIDHPSGQQASIGNLDSDWHSVYSALLSVLRGKQSLAVTGMALILVLFIYFATFTNRSTHSTSDLDLARNVQPDTTSLTPNVFEDPSFRTENPSQSEIAVGPERNPVNRSVTSPAGKESNEKSTLNKNRRGNSGSSRSEGSSGAGKPNISTTRGIPSKCGDLKPIDFEFANDKGSVVLKWRKIPNAIKYHLYISDDDEILIDEYETSEQTTYVFKKSLDKNKVYKWKVVILLDNGHSIVGISNKFSLMDFQSRQNTSVRRLNAEVRCGTEN
ncbi:MAG: hypothetical protein ACRENF_00750 [Thermodesulfobacteriota bacterium]